MQTTVAPRALFNEAIGHIKAGRIGAAEACCRRALERHPGDVNMEALLGAVLVKQNRNVEAESTLLKVIEAAPTFAKPAEDLGYLLVNSGRAAEALPILERATRLDPSLENAWYCLGRALAQLGRGKEAERRFREVLRALPGAAADGARGRAPEGGSAPGAEQIYRRVLRDNPRNVDALRLMALLATGADRADDAEAMLIEAVRIAPDYLLALLDLGQLRREQDRFAEALECFDRVLALEPDQPQAHFHRAATLARVSFTHEAIAAYRACLASRPSHLGALLGLGHVLNAVGDYEGAVASYLACVDAAPDAGETYWSLANLKTYRFDDATLADMEKRARKPRR